MSQTRERNVDQLMRDLQKCDTYTNSAVKMCESLAGDIAALNNDGGDKRIDDIRRILLEVSGVQLDQQLFSQAVEQTFTQLMTEEGTDKEGQCGGAAGAAALLNQKFADMKSKSSGVNNSAALRSLESRVKEALSQGSSQEDDDADVSHAAEEIQLDEDVAMTNPRPSLKCPYTGQEMVNPVRNKYCGHNYDLEGIEALISNRGKKARCPVGGCVNEKALCKTHLEPNEELKKMIERKNRKR